MRESLLVHQTWDDGIDTGVDSNTVWHLWPAALGLSFVALLAACFQKNYYLGDQQNCYDCKGLDGEVVDSDQEMHEAKVRSQEPLWKFWKY